MKHETPALAYAGIGSREAPGDVLVRIEALAAGLARRGYVLRTGMSPGADQAFYRGAVSGGGHVELYLPREGFQASARAHDERGRVRVLARPAPGALQLAPCFYAGSGGRPWQSLDACEQALLARDAHEVLGADLASPAAFVVCWTACASRDGRDPRTLGTGQALRIACARSVPVFNIANAADLAAVGQRVA